MELAKQIPDHYPDLIQQGGLAKSVQAILGQIGSSLSVSLPEGLVSFITYARIERGDRFSQISVASSERLFLFDFWNLGACLADGCTPVLGEAVRAINTWISSDCRTEVLATTFDFVRVSLHAAASESGREVEHRWQDYLWSKGNGYPELEAVVIAAAAEPTLRLLFPFTSLNRLCFSRCTGYPFTGDTPYIIPLGGDQYEVRSPSDALVGRGSAGQAVALVVAALPINCGPALPGTAIQFDQA